MGGSQTLGTDSRSSSTLMLLMCTCTVRSLVSQRAHGEITLSIVSIIRLHVMNNDKQMETGRKKEASRTEIFTSNLMDLIKVPALAS